jgi:hypothetical protein
MVIHMKTYILVDNNGMVQCLASEECNLHKDKLHMKKYLVEMKGTVGDAYDVKTDAWVKHPENYPVPTEEYKIQVEMQAILREQAITSLLQKGEIMQLE